MGASPMTWTVVFISALVVLAIGIFVLQVYSVKWGLRWTKIADISAIKAFLYLILIAVLASVGAMLIELIVPQLAGLSFDPGGMLLTAILQPIVAVIFLKTAYRAPLARALRATVPFVAATFGPTIFAIFIIRPFAYEAFVAPTNSMAPTILGYHWTGKCPHCGGLAYGSVVPAPSDNIPSDGIIMICSKELRSCTVKDPIKETGSPDRFLVSKLSTPRRWDVIVFRLPENPSYYYVKRLVGLPGEVVFLRDGAVWINGKQLAPPAELTGIEYLTTLESAPVQSWADESKPAELASGEYFVLGDFSAQASDSRFWQRGAPGHPPYAVPEDHIIGVVTHIYWPLDRWRAFR
jgi:signal peptidase I